MPLSLCDHQTDLFLIISWEFEVLWHGQFWFSPGTNFVGIRVAVLEHLRRAQASRTSTYRSSNGRPKTMLAWIYLLLKASTASNFTGLGSVEAQIFCLENKYRKHTENIEYILYKYVIPRMGGGGYIGGALKSKCNRPYGILFPPPPCLRLTTTNQYEYRIFAAIQFSVCICWNLDMRAFAGWQ